VPLGKAETAFSLSVPMFARTANNRRLLSGELWGLDPTRVNLQVSMQTTLIRVSSPRLAAPTKVDAE
jgi:hypothetical protein